ncbi:MAG: hypothetical protein HWE07_15155 [Cytophagia bacterium]|nr:hypothetical protein [Cytophagia bacterium]
MLFSTILVGQTVTNQTNPEMVVTLKENKNGVLRIRTELKPFTQDTVLIYLEETVGDSVIHLQTIESAYSFPLEITQNSINNQAGILVKYDLAARNGNQFLFLLSEETNKLRPVLGFWNLGIIQSIEYSGNTYNYSYTSCGCADSCWQSVLFEIQDFILIQQSTLACDCENLIRTSGSKDKEFLSKCQEFNSSEKFEKIENYWLRFLKDR